MPEQLALPGIQPPRPLVDRLFFAVFPDAAAAARIAALAQALRTEHGLKGKPLAAPRFHATLHFLGDHAELPQELVRAACSAASGVALPPFEVVFDRAASFHGKPRRRPFVLRGDAGELAALSALQHALGDAL